MEAGVSPHKIDSPGKACVMLENVVSGALWVSEFWMGVRANLFLYKSDHSCRRGTVPASLESRHQNARYVYRTHVISRQEQKGGS